MSSYDYGSYGSSPSYGGYYRTETIGERLQTLIVFMINTTLTLVLLYLILVIVAPDVVVDLKKRGVVPARFPASPINKQSPWLPAWVRTLLVVMSIFVLVWVLIQLWSVMGSRLKRRLMLRDLYDNATKHTSSEISSDLVHDLEDETMPEAVESTRTTKAKTYVKNIAEKAKKMGTSVTGYFNKLRGIKKRHKIYSTRSSVSTTASLQEALDSGKPYKL